MDLPYFPLWVDDWLASQATSAMSAEQEGAFIRLLMLSWRGSPACTLPDDDRALAQMSRLGTRWKKTGKLVREQFELVDGRLRNPKLYQVYQESVARHEAAVANGRLGGRPPKPKPEPAPKLPITSALPDPKLEETSGLAGLKLTESQSEADRNQEENREERLEKKHPSLPLTAREELAERLPTDADREALAEVLQYVPRDTAWVAEMTSAIDPNGWIHATPGDPPVTPIALGQALRDYVANGSHTHKPSLEHFRSYIRRAARGERRPPPSAGAGARAHAGSGTGRATAPPEFASKLVNEY